MDREPEKGGAATASPLPIVRRPLPLPVLLFLLHLYVTTPVLAVVGAHGLIDWQQNLVEANVAGFGFSCIFYVLGLGVAVYTAVLIHRRLPLGQPFVLIIMCIYLLFSMGALTIAFLLYRFGSESTELALIMAASVLCTGLYIAWFYYFKNSPAVRHVFNMPPLPEVKNTDMPSDRAV